MACSIIGVNDYTPNKYLKQKIHMNSENILNYLDAKLQIYKINKNSQNGTCLKLEINLWQSLFSFKTVYKIEIIKKIKCLKVFPSIKKSFA